MPFVKGNPGKPKGAKSNKTKTLEEKAQKLGCDFFEVLCRFAIADWKGLGYEAECYFSEGPDGAVKMGYVISPEMRLHAAKEGMKYMHCQKRAIEVTDLTENKPQEELVNELVLMISEVRDAK